MPRYLISFDDGTMTIPDGELPAVADAAHEVLRAAKAAGVWVTGGGLLRQQATYVAVDGTARPGPFPETKAVLGGFCVLDVTDLDEALVWAARTAAACRTPQEVRLLMDDPEV
ncbi:MAG: hypothetical protein KJS64_06590 [Acidobacteria bacterium]|nr:hypothetical protein [Acidobacteriota bacterium]